MDSMTASGVVTSLMALGILLVAATVLARDRRNADGSAAPGLMARMMRRYGVTRRDIVAAGLGKDFELACRKCGACKRTMQCCNWLHDAGPEDIALFCANEEFLERARQARLDSPADRDPRPAQG